MFTVASGSDEPSRGEQNRPKPASSLPTPKLRRGLKSFLADVVREMKKVSWPSKAETNRLTGVVLIVCLALVAILTGLGWLFELIINFITKGPVR
ncbi:MAG TPA: preprotein translocase subunit SecE [Fimbriimonas sp.]|nr:preprotein translocase subunit SecE [Fimbriimonas sp.]